MANLSFPVLGVTKFSNRNVYDIWCIQQRVELTGAQVPIVAHGTKEEPKTKTPASDSQLQKITVVLSADDATHGMLTCHPLVFPRTHI